LRSVINKVQAWFLNRLKDGVKGVYSVNTRRKEGFVMKVAIACDHGGFPLKAELVKLLSTWGHSVVDLGAREMNPKDDYPDFAKAAGTAIQKKQAERAVLICGSGVGACVAANKMKGVRAGLCHDVYSAHQCVEHDDVNVLCLGARIIGPALAADLLKAFVDAKFTNEDRHVRRLRLVKAIEDGV
jgi:ribose 5-phosphate isomerase B